MKTTYLKNPTAQLGNVQLPLFEELEEIKLSSNSILRPLQIQNRRFLGNKFKLLDFIEDIVEENCGDYLSFCDIFAGTGVVGERFNKKDVKVVSNDILESNYIPLLAWLKITNFNQERIEYLINALNNLEADSDNYVSKKFGGIYFTLENARKIGAIREKIDEMNITSLERNILVTSLIYAIDKVANTCGHYDAFRKKMDTRGEIKLSVPDIKSHNNYLNEVYKEDANKLIERIEVDILYMDPPYNSRQYSDTYHLLENIAQWRKPEVYGIAKKMTRDHLKSEYCLKTAHKAFRELIQKAKCKHILLSYNNTGEKKDSRSNARISDDQIIEILREKGETEVFEREYKAFTTGLSETNGHTERIFYCRVR